MCQILTTLFHFCYASDTISQGEAEVEHFALWFHSEKWKKRHHGCGTNWLCEWGFCFVEPYQISLLFYIIILSLLKLPTVGKSLESFHTHVAVLQFCKREHAVACHKLKTCKIYERRQVEKWGQRLLDDTDSKSNDNVNYCCEQKNMAARPTEKQSNRCKEKDKAKDMQMQPERWMVNNINYGM